MPEKSHRGLMILGIALALALIFELVFLVHASGRKRRDASAVYFEAVMRLKSPLTLDGYYVGDVAQLYRLGRISRDLAEADSAPIQPLVDRPRPFHGYFVRAMESAPSPLNWNDETLSLQGLTYSKDTSAICIYPAVAEEQGQRIYIVCPWGTFCKTTQGNQPVVKWPSGSWRQEWAIVD